MIKPLKYLRKIRKYGRVTLFKDTSKRRVTLQIMGISGSSCDVLVSGISGVVALLKVKF